MITSTSSTTSGGITDRSGTNRPHVIQQNNRTPSHRTPAPNQPSTRAQPSGAKRSARLRMAQSAITGHKFFSSIPGAIFRISAPKTSPAGKAMIPHTIPCINSIACWYCNVPSETGSTKLTRHPSVEATRRPAYTASSGVDASAAALAHPPISGASSIPGRRDESKGSGASPAFSATPGNAVTAMQ